MDDQEIRRRVPVWTALSDLFLDTEMQDNEHQHIARVISEAGYSAAEADHILRTEVAPVFYMNMLSVAGEWAGWSEEEVRKMVLERLSRTAWWQRIDWLRGKFHNRFMALVEGDWADVKKFL